MRLVTFVAGGTSRPGVYVEADPPRLLDLRAAWTTLRPREPAPRDLASVLALGSAGLDAVAEMQQAAEARASHLLHPESDVRLQAPIPRPPRMRDYLTYESHAQGADFALPPAFYEMPICYDGNPNSVIGPYDQIPWPPYTNQLDYELELALVIGKAGRDIPVSRARDHIAGITILNDVSARDIQGHEMTALLGPAKGKHFCNVLGPTIATIEELDEKAVELEARVNGEVWSRGTSADRRYSFAEVVAWASFGEDLQPGEILGLGTIGGGCGLELGRWIRPGDRLELEATRVGVQSNVIGAKAERGNAGVPSYGGSPPFAVPRLPSAAAR